MASKEQPQDSGAAMEAGEGAGEAAGKRWFLTSTQAALLGPFVDYMGLGSIFPLLPYFILKHNAPVIWLGIIVSVQYAALTFGSRFFGWLCDRFEPKNVMAGGGAVVRGARGSNATAGSTDDDTWRHVVVV